MTSLELLIQQSVEGEFRQHDGVMTGMMMLPEHDLPKHRYNMTEVDYGGGGHRTRLKDPRDQSLSLGGASLPVYKGVKEGEGAATLGAPHEESYSRRRALSPGRPHPPCSFIYGVRGAPHRDNN